MNNTASIPPSPQNRPVQPLPKRLSFYWSPQEQRFACDDLVSEGHGIIGTDPSHDLAHLIIAANGNLAWLPHGERDIVCFAEYNAVLLENLFDKTCNAVVFGTSAIHETLAETLKYMDWFANEHYAPFPVSPQTAFRRFCQQINPFAIAQLFPYYLDLKRYERTHPNYRDAEYKLNFTASDRPPTDELGWLAQWSIYRQLKAAQQFLGIEGENSALNWRITGVLEKINPLGETDSPFVKTSSAIAPNPSELDTLKQRLATVETQLEAVKGGLTARIDAIASAIGRDGS